MAYVKVHIATRILSGLEKETPVREKTSPSASKSDEEERIVAVKYPVIVNTIEELSHISHSPVTVYSGHITERQVAAEREHGSSKTVTCHARTRRKKKDRKSE